MRFGKGPLICVMIALVALVATASPGAATGFTLSTASTSLGRIVVNGKGMTAYFYDLDKANSGVSACTGNCAIQWPPIISKTKKITVSGVKGKITLLAHTKQIAINGRPIYTFAGDSAKGDTNGQGLGGVWYAISAKGVELNPTNLAKLTSPSELPMPTMTPESASTPTPSPTSTPSPTDSAIAGTYSNSNY